MPAGWEAAATAVVLDVSGMKCGGCSAAVKRILLQQPGVHAAAVNLLTETAVVQVAAAAATTRMDVPSPPPPQALAATAAEALTAKGFPSRLRSSEEGLAEDAATLSQRKEEELRKRCGGLPSWSHRRKVVAAIWNRDCPALPPLPTYKHAPM